MDPAWFSSRARYLALCHLETENKIPKDPVHREIENTKSYHCHPGGRESKTLKVLDKGTAECSKAKTQRLGHSFHRLLALPYHPPPLNPRENLSKTKN